MPEPGERGQDDSMPEGRVTRSQSARVNVSPPASTREEGPTEPALSNRTADTPPVNRTEQHPRQRGTRKPQPVPKSRKRGRPPAEPPPATRDIAPSKAHPPPRRNANLPKLTLLLEGKRSPVRYNPTPRYLGFILDETLTCTAHVDKVAAKMKRRVKLLRRLCGASWGCNKALLRQLYTAFGLAPVMYAGSYLTFCTAAARNKLDVIHREAARIISGCVPRCNGDLSLLEADLLPLDLMGQHKAAVQLERCLRLSPDNLCRRMAESAIPKGGKSRKRPRKSWLQDAQRTIKAADLQGKERQPLVLCPPNPVQPRSTAISIKPTLESPVTRLAAAEVRKAAAMETLQPLIDQSSLVAYTDGSVKGGAENGGGGYTCSLDGKVILEGSVPAGLLCSSYQAELTALLALLRAVIQYVAETPEEFPLRLPGFLVALDGQSVITRLSPGILAQTCPLEIEVWQRLMEIQQMLSGRVVIQYCPGHCGVEGNERADKLAETGTEQFQADIPLPFATAKAAIRRQIKRKWTQRLEDPSSASKRLHREITEGKPLREHAGSREEERTLAQLRTGCCRHLQSYMHHILKKEVPADCPDCGTGEPESTEHFMSCPAAKQIRQEIFGTADVPLTVLRTKTKLVAQYLRARARLAPGEDTPPTSDIPPPPLIF